MKHLTEDEFDDRFTPVLDARGDAIRPSTDGLDPDSTKLWTIVEGDSGSLYAESGVHRVNVLGFLVTEEEWDEPISAVWFAGGEESEEEAESA